MIQTNSRDFRSNQSKYFDKALSGEKVMIHRKNQIFMLVSVQEGDIDISPSLQKTIDAARQELATGKTRHFDNVEEMNKWLEDK